MLNTETTIREDRKRRGVGTFTWNHSLTFNISGSNKDIFKNKALIDSRGFFYFEIFNIFFYFDDQFGLRQQIRIYFLNPAFS